MNRELDSELRTAVRSHAESVQPTDRLGAIRHRTRLGAAPQWWRRPSALAAGAALVAASVVVIAVTLADSDPARDASTFSTGGDTTTNGVSANSTAGEVTVYFLDARSSPRYLAAESVVTELTGDPGLDAVRAMLSTQPEDPDYANGYHLFLGVEQAAAPDVASVEHTDGVITVDLTEDMWDPYPGIDCTCPDGKIVTQQLVWTVQSALWSSDPVAVTVDGEPARGIWMDRLSGPVKADPNALSPILIDSFADGDAVHSPVRVTGTSDTFEANVQWQVRRDGEVVDEGFTSGGTMGERGPFRFTVALPPGDYTVRAYVTSAEDGSLVAEDTKAFTVR